jgi:alkaline phosphatase D
MHTVPNVIILSGDRHEFAHIEFNPPSSPSETPVSNKAGGNYVVTEISTSPLSMFAIPFYRSLQMRSEEVAVRTKTETVITEGGLTMEQTIVEEEPLEKVIKYVGEGNYKWSSIEIDTRNLDKPTLRLETVIDGEVAYKSVIYSSKTLHKLM